MAMILFHQHLDACAHCADHPFALCLEGIRLLTAASIAAAGHDDAPERRVLFFPSFQTLAPPPIDSDDHEGGMQYLIYDPRSRSWLTERGDWSGNLTHARRFADYHTAAALRVTLPSAFALYVTEGLSPEQP